MYNLMTYLAANNGTYYVLSIVMCFLISSQTINKATY